MFILLPFQVVLLLILSNVYAKSRVAELLALPPKEHIDTDD
jgi:hypothetical protein